MQAQEITTHAQHIFSKATDRDDALTVAFKQIGWTVQFERNTEIQGEGEPADCFYQVVPGAVRTYKLLDDGRRQISAFHLPGDVIELEAGSTHRFSAETIAASVIRVAKRNGIIALAELRPEL